MIGTRKIPLPHVKFLSFPRKGGILAKKKKETFVGSKLISTFQSLN